MPSRAPDLAPPPMPWCDDSLNPDEAMRRAVLFDRNGPSGRNAQAAAACYAVAAHKNHSVAQYDLADMLMTGDEGVSSNPAAAVGWLEAAAGSGFVPAQTRLAMAKEDGTGSPPDMAAATYWYYQAAVQGDPYAQFQMSRIAYYGLDFDPDYIAAFLWLYLAQKAGYPPAQDTMHQFLNMVRDDGNSGVPGAQFLMGLALQFGVPGIIVPDPRSAYEWYRPAAEHNFQLALEAISSLCDANSSACR